MRTPWSGGGYSPDGSAARRRDDVRRGAVRRKPAGEGGDAGRSYGQSVTFRHGPLFVRLVAYQDTPQTERALVSLGQAIDARLGGNVAR